MKTTNIKRLPEKAREPSIKLGKSKPRLDGWSLAGMDYPTFRLTLVSKVMDRMTLRYFAKLSNVSLSEWRVLSRVCGNGEMTVGQIAEEAWVDRAEVSRAAAALGARGWMGRRANPNDGRTPIFFATEEGRQAYQPLLETRRQFHEDLLGDLSSLERELLDALLEKLADRLSVMTKESPGK
jgi:DNA-binding MarR family transcriptional regulator